MPRTEVVVPRATMADVPLAAHELGFPFDTIYPAVFPGVADTEKLQAGLQRALVEIPLAAGVVVRDLSDGLRVTLAHPRAGVPFTSQSTHDLAARDLANILDEGDIDDDGCTRRVMRWLLADVANRSSGLGDLAEAGRMRVEDSVGMPVLRVRLTQASKCYVVCLQASHLVMDAWSLSHFWVAWSRALALLDDSSQTASTDSAFWWDRACFWSGVPDSCPGRTQAGAHFAAAYPTLLGQREVELAAKKPYVNSGGMLWLRVSRRGMSALREHVGAGAKTFDAIVSLLTPKDSEHFRFAYDVRLSRPDADSSTYIGNGACLVFGRVASRVSVQPSDVRRALDPAASAESLPSLDAVVNKPHLGCSYWSHDPPGFPAGNAMPPLDGPSGRMFVPGFFLPQLQKVHVPQSAHRGGVLAYVRRVRTDYHIAAYGHPKHLADVATRIKSDMTACGLDMEDVEVSSTEVRIAVVVHAAL